MKKVLFILAITLMFIGKAKTQVFVTLNPAQGHFNSGLLCHKRVDELLGVYGSIQYGDIRYKDSYGSLSVDQLKYGAGVSLDFSKHKDVKLLLGLSRSEFFNYKNTTQSINLDNYVNPSVNIGTIIKIPTGKERVSVLFLTDVNNWASIIGIGFKF